MIKKAKSDPNRGLNVINNVAAKQVIQTTVISLIMLLSRFCKLCVGSGIIGKAGDNARGVLATNLKGSEIGVK